jgi:hypothetical protein
MSVPRRPRPAILRDGRWLTKRDEVPAFIVRFEPHQRASYGDCASGMYSDWMADHGPQMDAPSWLPRGGAIQTSAGLVAGREALADCGHVLREVGV